MSRAYKPIVCPECRQHIILMQLEGFIEGRIRIKCRRCGEFFIVTDEGVIANENTKLKHDEFEPMMKHRY